MTRLIQIVRSIVLISITGLLNVGCDNPSPQQVTSEQHVVDSDNSNFLRGAGVKGPLAYADVSVYTLDVQLPLFYDPNRPLITTSTTSTANYADLTLPEDVSYPLVLVIDGQDATDLNTGMQPVITTLINVITEEMATASQGVYATPLTTLTFRLARRMPEARANPTSFLIAMEDAAETVKIELGFAMNPAINILTDPPILTDETKSIEQQQQIIEHRAALEIVASLADLIGRNSDDETSADSILERFAADLAFDNTLDNQSYEGSLGYGDWLNVLSDSNNLTIPNTEIRIGDIENIIALETNLTGAHVILDTAQVGLELRGKKPESGISTTSTTTTVTTNNITTTTTRLTTMTTTTTSTTRATTTTTRATTTTTRITTTTTTTTTTTATRSTVTTTTTTTLSQNTAPALIRTSWKISADSEETTGASRPATYAIDGNKSTFWISEWYARQASMPHELIVDLGATYQISGFAYTGRDSTSDSRIGDYEFYVSNDRNNWGTAVSRGRFANNASEQLINFRAATGRFVRLRALSEISGKYYASVAEFNVYGKLPDTGSIGGGTTTPLLTKTDPNNDPITWSNLITDATGTIYWVASAAEFNSRALSARPGDVIIVRNGNYASWNLTIPSRGISDAPIIYTAETPQGVTISGTSRIKVTGSFNFIGGFIFNSLSSSNAITFDRASDNRFSGNRFLDCGSDNPEDRTIMVRNNSDRNRFDHNTMLRNKSFGMVIILPDDRDTSFGYSHDNRFDHNVFKDILTSPNGYGRIPLQFGQTVKHTSDESRTLVDHNTFMNLGQSAVNSKSTNETYLDNYFKDIIDNAGISMRAGDKKRAERNYFENVLRPIKINGENHVIANNIFINSLDFAVAVPSWGTFVGDNGTTTKYEPTGHVLITHNTIINTGSNGIEVGRRWGSTSTTSDTPPYNVTVTNNIVIGNQGTLLRVISSTNGMIEHNVLYATATAKVGTPGNSPYLTDPRLSGDQRPPTDSVAVNCAIPTTDIGTTDYYGRFRSRTADCGAVIH